MITADGTRESVHEFAQAVRDALSDLPADEVDELTDGLEADLFERADEGGGTDGFGDPAAYADELRVSAGLPERGPVRRTRSAPELRTAVRSKWHAAVGAVRRNPLGAWLIDLAVALRPVWWVLRGWVAWQIVSIVFFDANEGFLPISRGSDFEFWQWVLLLGLVLVSVQWGRGRWLPRRWGHGLLVLVSVVAVIALLPVLTYAVNETWPQRSVDSLEMASTPALSSDGMYVNGRQVYNIYAYDADGKPLQDVRLYDQDGQPLVTVPDPGDPNAAVSVEISGGQSMTLLPNTPATGGTGWAVYPLGTVDDDAPPFARVAPLPHSTPTPSSSPAPTYTTPPVPSPSSTPTPAG